MNTIQAKLLIDPSTHEVAAKLTEDNGRQTVEIYDTWLLHRLSVNGIAVPGGFADGKHYIYPGDKPELFAEAFTKEYFRHGLMQRGYYWVKEENYTDSAGEIQRIINYVLDAFKDK